MRQNLKYVITSTIIFKSYVISLIFSESHVQLSVEFSKVVIGFLCDLSYCDKGEKWINKKYFLQLPLNIELKITRVKVIKMFSL